MLSKGITFIQKTDFLQIFPQPRLCQPSLDKLSDLLTVHMWTLIRFENPENFCNLGQKSVYDARFRGYRLTREVSIYWALRIRHLETRQVSLSENYELTKRSPTGPIRKNLRTQKNFPLNARFLNPDQLKIPIVNNGYPFRENHIKFSYLNWRRYP